MNDEKRLESWKEIAEHLGRNTTTARRWEREEGLPVHRLSHKSRSSVYAYPAEIDTWRASRKAPVEPPATRPLWRFPAFAMTMVMCLIMVGNGIRPEVASAQQGGSLAKRLLCPNCANAQADLGKNGRWMVFADWSTRDLAIRDMSTGQVRRLMANTGTAQARFPIFSPDLRQIVYRWDAMADIPTNPQLRVMRNEPGGKSRVLIDNPENTDYTPTDWSRDGKSVLVVITKRDHTSQLTRVSVSDGAVKVLKQLGWRLLLVPSRPRFSPDGQYIAYSALAINPSKYEYENPRDEHIYILAADGSSGETEIVKTTGSNRHPVWTPDGKHILFTSDRSGKVDLWSIAVQNGKAAGAASLISPGVIPDLRTMVAIGMRGGSYYYASRSQNIPYIHIVEAVPGGNTQSGNAHPTENFVGSRPAWSPDGKSIAFNRQHPGNPGAYDLVVHSLDTGDERTYLTSPGSSGNGAPVWFHDGKSVMTGFGGAVYRVDLKTADSKKMPDARGALSPDDKTAYVVRRASDGKTPDRIVSIDLSTGKESQVFVAPTTGVLAIALSPDGRMLALGWFDRSSGGHIARVSVDGGDFRDVFSGADHLFGSDVVAWSKDGHSILFNQEQPGGAPWGVMRVPADGGGPATLIFTATDILAFDPSPDGSRIAYSANESANELWALDNVLSGLK